MTKYFLDTTILAEALLKGPAKASIVRARLSGVSSTVPMFAIKELKAGALKYWVYAHNKLVQTKSLSKTLSALAALSRTPQRYRTSSALEALAAAAATSLAKKTLEKASGHEQGLSVDELSAHEIRLQLRRVITQAWKKRNQVANASVCHLDCYQEVAPQERRGLLDLQPSDCEVVDECCLAKELRSNAAALQALCEVNSQLTENTESVRRGKALRQLIKNPGQKLTSKECRALGDALFAFFCPQDATILTTNQKDHAPLAGALSKKSEQL